MEEQNEEQPATTASNIEEVATTDADVEIVDATPEATADKNVDATAPNLDIDLIEDTDILAEPNVETIHSAPPPVIDLDEDVNAALLDADPIVEDVNLETAADHDAPLALDDGEIVEIDDVPPSTAVDNTSAAVEEETPAAMEEAPATIEDAPTTEAAEEPIVDDKPMIEEEVAPQDVISLPVEADLDTTLVAPDARLDPDFEMNDAALDSEDLATAEQPRDTQEQPSRALQDKIETLKKESEELRKLLVDSANQKSNYKEEIQQQRVAINEASAQLREFKNESALLREDIKSAKDRMTAAELSVINLSTERQRLLAELTTTSDELRTAKQQVGELRDANINCQNDLSAANEQLQQIELECENLKQQNAILEKSRVYFTDVEATLIKQRDEALAKESQLQQQLLEAATLAEQQEERLNEERKQHEAAIAQKDEAAAQLRTEIEKLVNEKQSLLDKLATAKIDCQRVRSQLDESFDSAADERNQLVSVREQFDAQIKQLEASKSKLEIEHQAAQSTSESELALKDREIQSLQSDIEKLNEKVKLYAKICNAENPEVMAPAATKTAKLMDNVSSLTELYAKHFGVVVELATRNAELQEAERALTEVNKMLVESGPKLEAYEEQRLQALREEGALRAHVDVLRRDREELVASRDANYNELCFTKEALEHCQTECQTLTSQLQHAIHGKAAGDGLTTFADVKELQQANIELVNRLSALEAEKHNAVETAHSEQLNEVKQRLEVAQRLAEATDLRIKHLTTCIAEAEKQRDHYRVMYEEAQLRIGESLNAEQVAALHKNLDAAVTRAKTAEQRLEAQEQDAENTQKQLETKVTRRDEAITKLKAWISTQTATIDEKRAQVEQLHTQLRNTHVAGDETRTRETTLARRVGELETANDKLQAKIAAYQNDIQTLKNEKSLMERQLYKSKNAEQLASLELNALKERSASSTRLTGLVEELTAAYQRRDTTRVTTVQAALTETTQRLSQLERAFKELELAKALGEDELKRELAARNEECGRLRVEHDIAVNTREPLEAENRTLRGQIKEFSDELSALHNELCNVQQQRIEERAVIADAQRLQTELVEAGETANYWQTRYENALLKSAGGDEAADDANCSNPSHAALQQYVNDLKTRINESQGRCASLHQQLSSLRHTTQLQEGDANSDTQFTVTQQRRFEHLEADARNAEAKHAAALDELKTATSRVAELTETIANNERELANLRTASFDLEAEKLALETQVKTLQTEAVQLAQTHATKLQEARAQTSTQDAASTQALHTRIDTLVNDLRVSNEQHTKLKTESEQKVAAEKARFMKLQQVAITHRNENERLKKELETATAAASTPSTSITIQAPIEPPAPALSGPARIAARTLGKLPAGRAAADKEGQMPIGRANMENMINNQKRQIAELQSQNQKLQERINQLEREVSRLTEQAIELEKIDGTRQVELQNKSEEIEAITQRNNLIAKVLDQTRVKNAELVKELEALQAAAASQPVEV